MGYVAVIGPGEATPQDLDDARVAAGRLAAADHVIVTGGLGGVMQAAAAGARMAGGIAVGLLPGRDRAVGSDAHAVLVPTGLGELRNGLVVRTADVVLAIGGSWGTLSEIALAVRTEVPVVALRSWDLPSSNQLQHAVDRDAAVVQVLALLASR